MNALVHLQAALDALDSEASELQRRLAELAAMRSALVPIINGHDAGFQAAGLALAIEAREAKTAPAAKTEKAGTAKPAAKTTPAAKSCPECARAFGSNVALGVHRRNAHGIAGSSGYVKKAQRPPVDADTLPAPEHRPHQSWHPAPGENVLACQEDGCSHVEPVTGATALNRHCLAQHRRAASVDERRPTTWDG